MKIEHILAVRQILFLKIELLFNFQVCILSYLCFVHFFTHKNYHQFFHTGSFNSKPCKMLENLQHNMVHRVDIFHITCMSRLDSVINFYIMHTFYNGLRSFLIDHFQFLCKSKLFLRNISSNFRTYFQHVFLENCIEI